MGCRQPRMLFNHLRSQQLPAVISASLAAGRNTENFKLSFAAWFFSSSHNAQCIRGSAGSSEPSTSCRLSAKCAKRGTPQPWAASLDKSKNTALSRSGSNTLCASEKLPRPHTANTDLILHPAQTACRTQPPHAIDHRIEQAKEHEAEVMLCQKQPLRRTTAIGARIGPLCAHLGKPQAKLLQQLPVGELLLIEGPFGTPHKANQTD